MIWAGLVLGFLGSLHCIGMCGPIAIAAFGQSGKFTVAPRLFYNLGRTATYTLMGLVMSLIGKVISLSGFQQVASILAGSIILLIAVIYLLGIKTEYPSFMRLLSMIKRKMSGLLRSKGWFNNFSLGLINGFLPCGLVYLALAGAIVTESPTDAVWFMFLFGLGTIPAMFSITYVAPVISRVIDINRLIPYMFAIVGIILVLRGLGLGIPFISPDLNGSSGHMHS